MKNTTNTNLNKILIADQDSQFLSFANDVLKKKYSVSTVETFDNVDHMLSTGLRPDVILIDPFNYVEQTDHLINKYPNVMFVIANSNPQAITSIKSSAAEVISKPITKRLLLETISGVLQLKKSWQHSNSDLLDPSLTEDIIFAGLDEEVKTKIKKASDNDITITLLGETGSGKTLIAKYIHIKGNRPGPFKEINCAAIPETMLESELFGYEAGAFTDATQRKLGMFELANNGTVFLDEIGDMSINLQSKILKVIEEKKFSRLGGMQELRFDTRLIVATNVNLRKKVSERTFRKDLFYRVMLYPIDLPPLRYRSVAVPKLTTYYINKTATKLGFRVEGKISNEIEDKLNEYSWPGNIRELSNAVVREVIDTRGNLSLAVFNFIPYTAMPQKRVLPRILIIDDQYGSVEDKGLREDLCAICGFKEIQLETPDNQIEVSINDAAYTAAVVFCSGQQTTENVIENDSQLVFDYISKGWPSSNGWRWSLIFLDICFYSGIIQEDGVSVSIGDEDFGINLLNKMVLDYPEVKSTIGNTELPVVMLSGLTDSLKNKMHRISIASGAMEYIEKVKLTKVPPEVASETIRDLLDRRGLVKDDRGFILGSSLGILKILRQARHIARLKTSNTLIEGEQVTGRAQLAEYIHDHSPRRKNPLIRHSIGTDVFDYATLSGDASGLTSSFLGETLLLENIDGPGFEKAAQLQDLIEKNKTDCLIATCAADFGSKAESDVQLLQRLKGSFSHHLSMPSLHNRKEDIVEIFTHFLMEASESLGDNVAKTVVEDVKVIICEYPWPSNLSELRRVAYRTASEAWNESIIYPRHLPSLDSTFLKHNCHGKPHEDITAVGKIRELENNIAELNTKLAESVSFESLPKVLNTLDIPSDKSILKGYMKKFNDAYILFFKRVLGAALYMSSEKFESAIKLLLDLDRETKLGGTAPSYVNKIISGKFIALNPSQILIKSRDRLKSNDKNLANELIEIYRKGKKTKK
jgi:DNA-binding NtrC family response regulator